MVSDGIFKKMLQAVIKYDKIIKVNKLRWKVNNDLQSIT